MNLLMNKVELTQIIELAKRLRMQDREDDMMKKISSKFNELDENERAVIGMRFIAGEDYGTIAQVLGRSQEESKNMAYQALKNLKNRVFGT